MRTVLSKKKTLFGLAGVFTAFIFMFLNIPVQAQPSITASQNPVSIPAGQTTGTTTLTWDGGNNHQYAEVWQQIDGGNETFVVEQGTGSRQMTVELGKIYVFKLADFGQTLASVTVSTKIASSETPSTSNGGVVTRPIPGGNHIAYITDVNTESKNSSVAINFWSLPSAAPMVEIGTTAPIQSNNRWMFPAGYSVGQGNAAASQKNGPLSRKVGVKANTLHRFESLAAGVPALEPGTTYWYIITGQNAGSSPNFFQTTGNFNTSSQTVKVVFEKILIIDDSDELSPAEINYWCWANYGHPSGIGWTRGVVSMSSGETYNVNKTFIVENAPKILSLSFNAEDDDQTFQGQLPPRSVRPPLRYYQNAGRFDENVAKKEWDLSRFPTAPGETFRQEFTLTSMDGGELQFEIYGYWEITRSN